MRSLDDAIAKAVEALCARQHEDGSWDFPCEFDPSYTALFLLLRHYLGWHDAVLDADMVRYLRHEQLPAGGWGGSPDSEPGLDITVLCYAAMKVAGVPAEDEALARARKVIRGLGGLAGIGFIPRLMLWALGQIPRTSMPYVSPRIIGLPGSLHVDKLGLVALGAVPYSLLHAGNVRCLPTNRGMAECLAPGADWRARFNFSSSAECGGRPPQAWAIRSVWAALDVASRVARRIDHAFPPTRARENALRWLMDHAGSDGVFGGSLVSTLLYLMALANVPGTLCEESVDRGMKTLLSWLVTDSRGAWIPFSPSTTLDTAWIVQALGHRRIGHAGLGPAVGWLWDHQVRTPGFWAAGVPAGTKPGGWAFSRENPWLPDTDDTAIVMRSLSLFRQTNAEGWNRGINWLLAMQERQGGWAGYNACCGRIPRALAAFGDPRVATILDPHEDITARVLMLLGPLCAADEDRSGRVRTAVEAGVRFLWSKRGTDGTWFGRWWVNRAYGTAQAVEALVACGHRDDSRIMDSVRWLESAQNTDGGWGESKQSYQTGRFEPGPSDPMTTAYVLFALFAAGSTTRDILEHALCYVLDTQADDGLWTAPVWSGVGVPGESYVRYAPHASVLLALAQAREYFLNVDWVGPPFDSPPRRKAGENGGKKISKKALYKLS